MHYILSTKNTLDTEHKTGIKKKIFIVHTVYKNNKTYIVHKNMFILHTVHQTKSNTFTIHTVNKKETFALYNVH